LQILIVGESVPMNVPEVVGGDTRGGSQKKFPFPPFWAPSDIRNDGPRSTGCVVWLSHASHTNTEARAITERTAFLIRFLQCRRYEKPLCRQLGDLGEAPGFANRPLDRGAVSGMGEGLTWFSNAKIIRTAATIHQLERISFIVRYLQ
jgi:hypothetical protein